MPSYSMWCTCGWTIEETRSIHKGPRKTCPECRKGLFQKFGDPYVFVRGEPTTFGQQSEKNKKKLGKEKTDQIMRENDVRVRRAQNYMKGLKKPAKGARPYLPEE